MPSDSSPYVLPAVLEPSLTGRDAIIDALHRCAIAFDTNDEALFDSAFMSDGIFEVNGRAMEGLPEIHSTGLALVFSVDTTHLVTNVRAHIPKEDGESKASVTATVLSQHFAKDKGMELDQKSLMSGSLYHGDLAKDNDGLWKFKYLRAKSIWVDGDWSVVGGKFHDQEE